MTYVHRPILEGSRKFIHGDLGDARLVHLFLEHGTRWLTGETANLWTAHWSFYPSRNSFARSENLLGTAPFYAMFRMGGLSPPSAYQSWFLLMSTLNYFLFLRFLMRLGLRPIPGALGAFLFAFSMPVSVTLNHPQFMTRFFMPLALTELYGYTTNPPGRRGIHFFGFVLFFAWQLWSGLYAGWFFALLLVCMGVLFLFQSSFRGHVPERIKSDWPTLVGGTALLLALSITLLIMYTGGLRHGWDGILGYMARARDYLHPISGSYVYEFQGRILGRNGYFAGWVAVLLAGSALWTTRNRRHEARQEARPASRNVIIAAAGVLLVLFVLTTKWGDFSFWKFIYSLIPGGQSVRGMSRIYLILLIPFSMLTAFALDIPGRRPERFAQPLMLCLAFLVVAENAHHNSYNYGKAEHLRRVEVVRRNLGPKCESFYLIKKNTPAPITHIDAMWASLETGVPTINGYSGSVPEHWSGLQEPERVNESMLREWLRRNKRSDRGVCLIRLP